MTNGVKGDNVLRAVVQLKHCHHRHTLTPIKVWRRVQREPFQRRLFAPRRAQNLLAGCIFVGIADKSAFALLSQKVTKARRKRRKEGK